MGPVCCKADGSPNEVVARVSRSCVHSKAEAEDPNVLLAVRDAMPGLQHKASYASGADVLAEHFPMHTVPVPAFMALTTMETFGQLHARGVLVSTPPQAVIHFISHEWLGFTHPDPDGEQLHRMQEVFQTILEGRILDLFHPDDWKAYSEKVSSGSKGRMRAIEAQMQRSTAGVLTEKAFMQHVAEGEVWLDYASIPQRQDFVDPVLLERVMARAVRSIPAYLERCHYFWVLTPTAKHVDKGTWCSFTTWRSRGWCRLEEWGNFLSTNSCAPLIITHSPKLCTIGLTDFTIACAGKPDMAPCAGAFTCCRLNHEAVLPSGDTVAIPCDKDFVLPVLAELFGKKRRQLQSLPNSSNMLYGFLRAMVEPMIFGGAKSPLNVPGEALEESIPDFLERWGLTSLSGTVGANYTVWHFVAMVGSMPMLRKLQEEPEAMALIKDPDREIVPGCTFARKLVDLAAMQGRVQVMEEMIRMGIIADKALDTAQGTERITPLDRAAKYGFADMVSFLLDRRADLNNRRNSGATPLHGAAEAGHSTCCMVLLERRADVNAVDGLGRSPLHLAADPVTFYGRGEGKPAVLEVLLLSRADANLKDERGQTALDIARAARFYDGEDVFMLVDMV